MASHALLVEELVTGTRATQTGRVLEGAGQGERRTLVDRQGRTLIDLRRRTAIGIHPCTSFPRHSSGSRTPSQQLLLLKSVTGSESADTGHPLEGAGQRKRRTLVGTHRYTPFDHLHAFVRTRCHNRAYPVPLRANAKGRKANLLVEQCLVKADATGVR